jgi:hypothetical protein
MDLCGYEDMQHALCFPTGCRVEFHGLVTHYKRDVQAVMQYVRSAIKHSTQWEWRIGYYDGVHHSMLATLKAIKNQEPLINGSKQEELSGAVHVTPNPPHEPKL